MRLKLFLAAVLPLAFIPSTGSTAAVAFAPPFDACNAEHSSFQTVTLTGYSDALCDAPGGFRGEGAIAGLFGGLGPSVNGVAEARTLFTITRDAPEAAAARIYLVTVRFRSARVASHAPDINSGKAEIVIDAAASMEECECRAADMQTVLATTPNSVFGMSNRLHDTSFTLTLVLLNAVAGEPVPAGNVSISVNIVGSTFIPAGGLGSYDFDFDGAVTSVAEV